MATCIYFIRMGKRKPPCRYTSAQIEFNDPLAHTSLEISYLGGLVYLKALTYLCCVLELKLENCM